MRVYAFSCTWNRHRRYAGLSAAGNTGPGPAQTPAANPDPPASPPGGAAGRGDTPPPHPTDQDPTIAQHPAGVHCQAAFVGAGMVADARGRGLRNPDGRSRMPFLDRRADHLNIVVDPHTL